ncbi:type VI secretion system protein [Pseudomonas sp. GOM7]|uniref:type VI secretion system protein n=1 Tax=Pseudomonas sp. GOM7 TaxID=2998079 RepID=UPI00227B3B5F|nr:type VI secretion system protein [Pseudomonas sp. GOM7]WAJ39839.1 type VI secretion system protein [Pseudomonas sp. GOM7]
MSTLTIVLYVLGALLLLALLVVAFWWLRTQSGTAIRSFYAAVRKMEHDQGIESRYQTPWLMLLGDPREGSQLCADWQLTPVGRASWFGRWWADPDGAVLVVPQALFLPQDNGTAPTFVWRRLLGILQRLRGQRPLDGIVWVIPLAQLQNEELRAADVLVMRRRFTELLQRLGLSLPVHVLISGLEALPGFQELLAVLPEESREQTLGWSSPYSLDASWQSYWLDDAGDQLIQAVQAAIMEAAALKGEVAEELYRLPDQLAALKDDLRLLLEPVFQGNAQGEAPRLRGIYLTAAQASAAQDDALSSDERAPAQGVFTQQLWQRRLLAEQGLAQAVPRILNLRRRWQKTVAGIAGVIGLCWAVAMLWIWQQGVTDARVLSRLLQETHGNHQSMSQTSPERNQAYARQNVQGFWNLLQQAPRWHYASLVYPTSWGTALDDQLDLLLRNMAQRSVVAPLRQLQFDELTRLQAIRISERRTDVQGAVPDQWPSYVKARSLAEGVINLERQNKLLRELLSGQQGVVEPMAQLGNDALGLNLDPTSLNKRAFYDRTLRGLGVPRLAPPDLEAQRKALANQFQTLMRFWLTQYFLADNFVRPAGYLKRYLNDMEYGRDVSLQRLEEINAYIGHLEDLIILTNSAWSHGSNEDLTPGYRDLMNSVQQSSVFGPAVVSALDDEAKQLRQDFQTQWIAGSASQGSLLQRQAGGSLMLQEPISKLSRSIDDLLKRDFAVVALRDPDALLRPRAPSLPSEQRMAQALAYQQSYRDYVDQELPQIAPDYRTGMLKVAGDTVALAMWSALYPSARPSATSTAYSSAFGEQASQVIQGFKELGRGDLAGTLQTQLTLQAMANVDKALEVIDALALFTQRYDIADWNGDPNLGLLLYRSSDVQDLKTFLAGQFTTVSASSEAVLPELNWLRAQPDLPLTMQSKVARLSAMHDEVLKYKAQNPTSAPALFEQLVTRDLVEMNLANCAQVLTTATLPQGAGDLAQYTRSLNEQAYRRCHQLQVQDAAEAWRALADYFNQYLAGRFPFSYSLDSADADPARVRHLLELIDTHLPTAEKGLSLASPGNRLAAEDFIARMKQARVWLGPLLIRDQAGVLGIELDVRWRTDREQEQGADQVITWSLHSGNQQIAHPGEAGQRLRWNLGEPLQLVLRWARGSQQRPVSDPMQPSMAVNELEAGWEYRGPWALLRLLRTHVMPPLLPNVDYTDFPLTLQVPVHGIWDATPQAQMFMRVSMLSQGSKLPLAIPPLPVSAPGMPFGEPVMANNEPLQ